MLTPSEKANIYRFLTIPLEKQKEIGEDLDKINSEASLEVIRGIIQELTEIKQEKKEAASGLIKADVLEWSERRNCTLKSHYKKLQYELSIMIGYKDFFPPLPF